MSIPMAPTTPARTQPGDKRNGDFIAFKAQGAQDPFLTNAPGYSDQLTSGVAQFTSGDIQMQGEAVHPFAAPTQDASSSVSPAAIHAPNISRNPSDQPSSGSLHDWLSPSHHTDMSGYTSSEFDDSLFLQPDLSLVNGVEDWTNAGYYHSTTLPADTPASDHGAQSNTAGSAATSNQLLSPVPTSTPSPPAGGPVLHTGHLASGDGPTNSPQSLISSRETRQNGPSPPPPSSSHLDTLNVEDHNQRAQPPSPIVRVSSYTRGDSPSREDGLDRQKPVKRGRNRHLAPEDDSRSSDSEEEDTFVPTAHRRTISVPTSALRNNQGVWLTNPNTGQSGLDPTSRGDAYVLSPKEMMARQQLEEKNAEVANWLSNSEANSDIEERGTRRFRSRVARKLSVTSRRRARSTGDPSITGRSGFSAPQNFDDSAIPGPGALIKEQSDEEEDVDNDDQSTLHDSAPESPPAQVNISFEDNPSADGYFPPLPDVDPSNEEQPARQFIRATPWQDPLKMTSVGDTKDQPDTSNAAMMRFRRRAENIETASRAATCGTGGASEADVESIMGPEGRFSNLHIGRERTKSRTNSLLGHASKFLPRRGSSNSGKRKYSQQAQPQPDTESPQNRKSNDTADGISTPSVLSRRKNSFSRPAARSANSAVMAMTEQIAAIGGGANGVRHTPSPSTSSNPLDHLRRRSKSEAPCSHGSGGLMSLMTSVGGPPMPTLASPVPDKDKKASPSNASERMPTGDDGDGDDDDDIEDDDATDDKGVVMEFPVNAELIVPSLDGFRTHVRQLNPRLPPALVERIATEQVRRYKKLVEMKTKHTHAVSKGTCPAGNRCLDQGGTVTYLAPRASPKDPDSTYGQFQVPGNADDAPDDFSEGAIVPALFPSGVPLPPVTRLPAEFECSLCFKVKKFQKPSDWTKHVHEDLQPFTCSFPECTEPKSFKRKADWVRHESERHRHLEWWTCNMPDCPHTCYRKNNFVQHLTREHKMPDPKAKPAKNRTDKNANGSLDSIEDQWEDELWRRVEECRHISPKQPKDENCRFCGNVCNSWKKLTVHMAKHMEQIAMPVLELVKQVKVSDGTHAEGDKIDDLHCQQQPSDNTLSTPVSAYPSVKPEPPTNSPASSLLNSTTHIYGTNAVPAETFGVPTTSQPSLSAQHLQVQDALTGMPSHSGGQLPATAPSYPGPSYSQANAASLGLQQMYHQQPHQQQHPPAQGNSVSYPPPFNAIPRQQGTADIASYAPPPVTMGAPYGLDINAAVQPTGFDGQQLYASPVDNMGYTYPAGEYDASGQQIPINHHGQANNMAFPDGTMPQGNSYLGQGHGQY